MGAWTLYYNILPSYANFLERMKEYAIEDLEKYQSIYPLILEVVSEHFHDNQEAGVYFPLAIPTLLIPLTDINEGETRMTYCCFKQAEVWDISTNFFNILLKTVREYFKQEDQDHLDQIKVLAKHDSVIKWRDSFLDKSIS